MTSDSSYSIRWAQTIVQDLIAKHARATEIARRFLRISDQHLAFLLSSRPNQWRVVRNFVKAVDKALYTMELPSRTIPVDKSVVILHSKHLYSNLVKSVPAGSMPSLAQHISTLTAEMLAFILEELVIKGVGGGNADPNQPLSPGGLDGNRRLEEGKAGLAESKCRNETYIGSHRAGELWQ